MEIWEEEKGREITLLPQNKVVQDLEWNEENRCPDPDSKINYTEEPNETHRNILKEEILQSQRCTRLSQPKCTGGTQEISRQQN
jgi:hypothetical protein